MRDGGEVGEIGLSQGDGLVGLPFFAGCFKADVVDGAGGSYGLSIGYVC